MLTATETEAAHEAASHAGEAFDPGTSILHHVLDSNEFEIPWFSHKAIPLPHLELFGFDISITKHVLMLWIASALLFIGLRMAVRRSADPVPRGWRNALEILILFIRNEVARPAIPHGADRYLGYLLTTFFFIVTCNLLGLIPGMATATGNISVTAGLAFVAFIVIQAGGIKQYGVMKHIGNLVPPGLPILLVPLMALLEFLTQFVRPFALTIRLFANMMAGHVVILAFISLIFILTPFVVPVSVFFALFVHFLELLVAFLQAYIFTVLTANFIGMSVHPAH